MKYLPAIAYVLVITVVIVVCKIHDHMNYTPKFTVGDCLKYNPENKEKWEKYNVEYVIIDIGKFNYRLQSLPIGRIPVYSTVNIHQTNLNYAKSDCP